MAREGGKGDGAKAGGTASRADPKVLEALKRIHSNELSGMVRYLHYAHMIFGANRIPMVAWLKEQATEAMDHAWRVGEKITAFGCSLRTRPQIRGQS